MVKDYIWHIICTLTREDDPDLEKQEQDAVDGVIKFNIGAKVKNAICGQMDFNMNYYKKNSFR